jgi:hypothetical protein
LAGGYREVFGPSGSRRNQTLTRERYPLGFPNECRFRLSRSGNGPNLKIARVHASGETAGAIRRFRGHRTGRQRRSDDPGDRPPAVATPSDGHGLVGGSNVADLEPSTTGTRTPGVVSSSSVRRRAIGNDPKFPGPVEQSAGRHWAHRTRRRWLRKLLSAFRY